MKKIRNYVKRDFVKSIKGNYVILLGQRSNGKSFCVKEDVIKNCLERGEQFAYIRRYKEDCKQYMIQEYFSDIICDSKGVNHLEKWSNGKYNTITVSQQVIYLAHIDEDEHIERGQKLGRMFGLSWATHYKSLSFPYISTAVFEEFVTDDCYLSDNEPRMFMQLISTIFREKSARVYMVGNTVSRINPYVAEWGLKGIAKQKLGTVDYYKQPYTDENGETQNVTIAVYLTHSTLFNSGMFFGNSAKQIVGGMWECDEHPHLFGSINDYNILHTLVFRYNTNMFLMQFIQDKNDRANFMWFVTPKTTERLKPNTRIVCNKFVNSKYATVDFVPLSPKERQAFQYIVNGKVVFSDNLTGTEFYQCYNNM